jgi:hypothetical protein
MAAAARNWGSYIRRELNSINAASRATDLKTLREIVDTLRVVVNRCCAAEKNAEGLEEPPAAETGVEARLVAAEQAAEPHEWVRNGNGREIWYRNTVTDETAWEVPPGGIFRENGVPPSPTASEANENERPPPPPVEAGAPRFATAANRAAARGGVPPLSGALAPRAGRLAPNMGSCEGVTPEDCRAARVKLRRANSQLAASAPAGYGQEEGANIAAAAQSGGKRRRRNKTKKNMRACNYRRTNRR